MKGRCVNSKCPRYGDEREMVEHERCYPCMAYLCAERPSLLTADDLRFIRDNLDWDDSAGFEIVADIERKLRPYIPELRAFDQERRPVLLRAESSPRNEKETGALVGPTASERE